MGGGELCLRTNVLPPFPRSIFHPRERVRVKGRERVREGEKGRARERERLQFSEILETNEKRRKRDSFTPTF